MSRQEYMNAMTDQAIGAVVVPMDTPTSAGEVARERSLPIFAVAANPPGSREAFRLSGDAIGPARPLRRPEVGDVALVVHTSGTTGRPKRIPRTHGNVVASSRDVVTALALTPADRCLNLSPMAFSQGANALFTTIWAGGSLVATRGPDLPAFAGLIRTFRPSWLSIAPTVVRAIVDDTPAVEALREHPLRVLRISTGPVSVSERTFFEATLGTAALNTYGMSEASFIAGEQLRSVPRKPGSVGPPAHEVAIVDESGNVLATGQTGEIVVRGPNVFPGYLGDPEANAAAFLPGGWFRTGDLGSLDEDGYLYVTGRLKEMIKRGGMAISPSEIDDALCSYPGVAEAAVFAVPDHFLGEDIVAAVALRSGVTASPRALRAWMLDRLAPHKVPRRIWFVPQLPRTETGKVMRHELARQFQEARHG
jgi:acyl-coenzyme A synthetase/AMP-(fatty) acid ligase